MQQDLEGRIKHLEAKVQELNDREAIRRLRYRYHELINEGRWAEVPGLFTEDGESDFGYLGRAKGRSELTTFFTETISSLFTFLKQFIHNHVVDVGGDSATGFSYLEAKSVSQADSYVVAARYDDEYVRRNGQWLFKRMVLTPYFTVPLREGWAQEDRLKMGRK